MLIILSLLFYQTAQRAIQDAPLPLPPPPSIDGGNEGMPVGDDNNNNNNDSLYETIPDLPPLVSSPPPPLVSSNPFLPLNVSALPPRIPCPLPLNNILFNPSAQDPLPWIPDRLDN